MSAFLVITFQGAPVTNHAGPSKQLNFISVQLKLIIIICITKIVSREPNVLSCYLIACTKITSLLTNRNSCRSICVACSINSLKCTNCSLHGLFLIHYHDKTIETPWILYCFVHCLSHEAALVTCNVVQKWSKTKD